MSSIDWRSIVIEELKMLSSEDNQLAYEANVSHVDITAELLCGWFDDTYHPQDEFFKASFNDAELKVLANFNELFEQKSGWLPLSNGTVKTWLNSKPWQEVMCEAKHALQVLTESL